MEQNSQQQKDALRMQIREAYGRVVYTYTTHLKKADHLVIKNKRIKRWQIALSAISTGGIIGAVITNKIALTWVGGIFSTVLLGLNLYFKEYDLNDEIGKHRSTADDLWLVREQYVSLLTDIDSLPENTIMAKRDELQVKTAEIYKKSLPTDAKSYAAAQNALKSEEEQYFEASEIDKMLPEHLRQTCKADMNQEKEC